MRHLSEEHKKKISLANSPPWNKGKHHSEETRKKISLDDLKYKLLIRN